MGWCYLRTNRRSQIKIHQVSAASSYGTPGMRCKMAHSASRKEPFTEYVDRCTDHQITEQRQTRTTSGWTVGQELERVAEKESGRSKVWLEESHHRGQRSMWHHTKSESHDFKIGGDEWSDKKKCSPYGTLLGRIANR